MKNTEEKVAVITGDSSGPGEATARMLSSEGAIGVPGASRTDRIQALAEKLKKNDGRALALTTDVTDS